MSYQILPNIIFILSVLGILLLILKRLPEASALTQAEPKENAEETLLEKGLPTKAISNIKVKTKFIAKKIWNFVLEAKDLKPHEAAGYKIKKIFGGKLSGVKTAVHTPPKTFHTVKNEQYFLDIIKLEPKNLTHYDALGKYYLENHNVTDAKDIYLYLTKHQPGNEAYHAKLAFCYYQTKNFNKAAEHYQKSLALDSTQPNRYYNLGLSLEASKRHEEALKAIAKALEIEPTNEKYKQTLQKIKK